jgi:uncharacterized protein YaaR (DUF327 family)
MWKVHHYQGQCIIETDEGNILNITETFHTVEAIKEYIDDHIESVHKKMEEIWIREVKNKN